MRKKLRKCYSGNDYGDDMREFDADFWWKYFNDTVKIARLGKRYNKDRASGKSMQEIDNAIARGCIEGIAQVVFTYLINDVAKMEIKKKTTKYIF